ncbi:MAG: outer membrane protein assembly factor [bacterium]|nr:outer membrane protein assembly factor [bacterium]
MGKKINSQWFAEYRLKEDPFFLETKAMGIQQKVKVGNHSLLSYNYRLSWNRMDSSLSNYKYRVGSVGVSFNRDTRNDVMNAVSGSYGNTNVTVAHKVLGSQVKYIRFSNHFSYYKKLGPLVYAGAVRLGLLKDFGIETPYGEKFFAGGGTTIRGFGQNMVGPLDGSETPMGGNALFILNQELRFRFTKLLGAVVFFDMGNVFPQPDDFAFSDFRKSLGIGLRVHTPYMIFRLDWGFKLKRRPGESASTIFFSIGQAF